MSDKKSDKSGNKAAINPLAVYSREEAAHALGISLSTLKKWINAGDLRIIPPTRLCRIFVRGDSILALLDQTVRSDRSTR